MTVYILPTKTRGCAPQSPETDEDDENGGCPSDKTRVCQKQGFRHPDICYQGGLASGSAQTASPRPLLSVASCHAPGYRALSWRPARKPRTWLHLQSSIRIVLGCPQHKMPLSDPPTKVCQKWVSVNVRKWKWVQEWVRNRYFERMRIFDLRTLTETSVGAARLSPS